MKLASVGFQVLKPSFEDCLAELGRVGGTGLQIFATRHLSAGVLEGLKFRGVKQGVRFGATVFRDFRIVAVGVRRLGQDLDFAVAI